MPLPTAALVLSRKLTRSLRTRGLSATARAVWWSLGQRLRALSPAWRAARRRDAEREAAFDAERGVDTAGRIAIAELDGIVGVHADHAERYQAVDPEALRAALAALALDEPRWAFLDLGCGKGRALLVAGERPFRQVVGVEFAPALAAAAARNVAVDRGPRRARDVRVLLGDAVVAPLPAPPLVVFLFNPFGAPVLRAVLTRLRTLCRERPSDLRIVYVNPRHADVLEEHGFVRADDGRDDAAARFYWIGEPGGKRRAPMVIPLPSGSTL